MNLDQQMMACDLQMERFIKNMPKFELHAHLNGSLSITSIQELGWRVYGEHSQEFCDMINRFVQFSDKDGLDSCFQKFSFMHELTSTKKGLEAATEMVIRDFASDNVIYLELRTTPKCNDHMNREEYLDIIIQTIQKQVSRYSIMVKLLVSIDRGQSVQVAEEILDLAIQMNKRHPNIVKGMDLSGNPNKGTFKDFVPVLEKAKKADLKLALHCAEVLNETEAQEMLDFDFQRCGHGTFLLERQLEQCRNQNITIECCLTSNVKCCTVKSYITHHFFNVYAKNAAGVVLCTDDSGVFSTSLSEEFSIAKKVFGLSVTDLHDLCRNAIESSFADVNEKTELMAAMNAYFNKQRI